MKKLNKRKLLSLILACVLLCTSLIAPQTTVSAEDKVEELTILDGMVLSKTVEKTGEANKFKITLGAYSTGEGKTIESSVSRPVDIVLIVDQSGSMGYSFGSTTRLKATQNAIDAFIENVQKDAKDNDVNHRIAVLGYSGDEDDNYVGTELLIGKSHYNYGYENYTTESTKSYKYELYNGKTNVDYWANQNSLYEKIGDTYRQVTLSVAFPFKYTYNFKSGSVTFSGMFSTPSLPADIYVRSEKKSLASDKYGSAFQDVTTTEGISNLSDSVDELSDNTGTYPTAAIKMAEGIFDAYKADYADDERSKVVIFFTDGYVGNGNSTSSLTSEANSALSAIKEVKGMGATVFTVGVFDDSDCTTPQTLPENSGSVNMENRFLYLLSSYYPNAESMTNTGSVVSDYADKEYYMTPNSAEGLIESFNKITKYIHTEYTDVKYSTSAQIRDVITPYFAGPTDISQITRYYLACTGIDPNDKRQCTFDTVHLPADDLVLDIKSYSESSSDDTTLVGDVPNDTVIATNFDYKKYWCGLDSGTPHGKKVVLEFYVTVRDGFLGGNIVPTNQEISGLYSDDGTLVPGLNFPKPELQDVEVTNFDISVGAAAKNVYLYSTLNKEQLSIGGTIHVYNDDKTEDCVLKLDAENFGVSQWRVDYIDVETVMSQCPITDIVADTSYNIKGTVSPKETGTYDSRTATSENADVLVYVPRITTKDTTANAGTTPDYADNIVSVDWVHKNKDGKWVTSDNMIGDAPSIKFDYSPEEDTLYGDTYVNINKVWLDKDGDGEFETDITNYCLFVHEDCTVSGCTYDKTKGNFLVHVNNATGNLVIKNTGATVDSNDTFVYYVTSASDTTYKQTVIIKGKGEAVITGLPVGSYTVTQDEDWSFNYECKSDNPITKTIVGESSTSRSNVFTFENAKDTTLNIRTAWDFIKNLFKLTGIVSSK